MIILTRRADFFFFSSFAMHITEIHLENFRSFGSSSPPLELHPHVNVVVGRNGSGKSSLVEAVAFVLQARNCSPQERRHLIHDGRDRGAGDNASVKIVLDNSDRRLPVDDDRVVVARTVGPVKEDQLFLQGRRVQPSELQGLLESAGFSRSNPYYVVRQGKVSELATCGDQQRLEVVRELTGAMGFDQCRRDAERRLSNILEELEDARERLEELDRHVGELREDCEQLGEFQTIDKKKRAVDFVLDEKTKKSRAEAEKKLEDEILVTLVLYVYSTCTNFVLSVRLFVCVCLSVRLSVCLSVCPSVCLSVCLCVCLSWIHKEHQYFYGVPRVPI